MIISSGRCLQIFLIQLPAQNKEVVRPGCSGFYNAGSLKPLGMDRGCIISLINLLVTKLPHLASVEKVCLLLNINLILT